MSLKSFKTAILIASICLSSEVSIAKKSKSKSTDVLSVKLTEIFQNPDKYNGKKITITGCFVNEFEGTVLSALDNNCSASAPNGLWVEIPKGSILESKFLSGKKYEITISGKVNSKLKGHMGAWSATLENVSVTNEKELQSGK